MGARSHRRTHRRRARLATRGRQANRRTRTDRLRRRPAPPSPLTIASRQLEGFRGEKSLIVRGDLRNAIGIVADGDRVFVGVPRKARNKSGEALVDLAQVQEFGGPPVVIPITPKMRKFLFAMLRRAGKDPGTGGGEGSGRGVVVVQVPARPFLRPAFEKFRQGAQRRFLERVAATLWGLG